MVPFDDGFMQAYALPGGWTVRMRVLVTDSGPLVDELHVFPTTAHAVGSAMYTGIYEDGLGGNERPDWWEVPTGGLNTRVIRTIPLGGMFKLAVEHAIDFAETFGKEYELLPDGWADPLKVQPGASRLGRKGHTNYFYARAAARYVALVRGGSRSPVKDMTAELDYVSEAAVRDWISQARARDLLTATERGRKGGELTQTAIDLLNEGEGESHG